METQAAFDPAWARTQRKSAWKSSAATTKPATARKR